MKQARLTTFDNPYDPKKDFQLWFIFDVVHGYNTCALLDNIVSSRVSKKVYDEQSDEEREIENEAAIDAIIKYDFQNIYKKVYVND